MIASAKGATESRFRIDTDHGNSFTAWQRMGSPQKPTPQQYARLEAAGQLTEMGAPEAVGVKEAKAAVRLTLPRHGVSLLVLEWGTPAKGRAASPAARKL